VSAIFISYTGRDPEGNDWADRLTGWFQEWKYGYFRDKDHSHGVKAGDDWRQTLFGQLADARAMVCLCSKQYDSSPWCVGEVAIAVKDGMTVIPIQLAKGDDLLQREPLPLLLQTRQAIKVADATNPSPETLVEVKQRLQASLQERLNWRDLQHWDRKQIFISYPYRFKELYSIAEKYLLNQDLEVVTGKDIDGRAVFRHEIIDRIKSCHGFVGIWKCEEELGPIKLSPWLSWELGVAQTCKMPAWILPHENIAEGDFMPHRTILPVDNMQPFCDCDFAEYLPRVLSALKDNVRQFDSRRRSIGSDQYSKTN
jgi:hypothetical protein